MYVLTKAFMCASANVCAVEMLSLARSTVVRNNTDLNTPTNLRLLRTRYVGGWPGDPSWGSISSVLPYTVWKGGDDALVADYYDGAKRNVDFFIRESAPDGLIEFGFYGDWLSLASIGKPQVTATAQLMATSHLVEMAQHLGKAADAGYYNATLQNMKKAYHAKYWDP
jgi:hypothetical protein